MSPASARDVKPLTAVPIRPQTLGGASPWSDPHRSLRALLQPTESDPAQSVAARPWWTFNAVIAMAGALGLVSAVAIGPITLVSTGSVIWWYLAIGLHAPFLAILVFLAAGLVERFGYLARARAPRRPGRPPPRAPRVCVQLPMFNEREVARRTIESACALDWPHESLEIQVLDDSTDPDARRLVDDVCAEMRTAGVNCRLLRREHRVGYKAGALEVGRRVTEADLIAILDADFIAPPDFLTRIVPHFFDDHGEWEPDLALVQAQWGHLNADESALTKAQSLWVDDHHTVQMSWRSSKWDFVNFTGTAGVWRAEAIDRAGGWRAASLVEDCELSFRSLFAGYRTAFVKEIVVPAELPATFTAYKAQQKRWTQGWVQLQRMHLRTLLSHYESAPIRRLHLLYHMCVPWQWALWGIWMLTLPYLIMSGLWFGALGTPVGVLTYLAPMII